MSEPPVYDPTRPCPKCGNPICSSEFRPGGGSRYVYLEPYDRMVRHCGRCDYRWYELPLDQDPDREDDQRQSRLHALRLQD